MRIRSSLHSDVCSWVLGVWLAKAFTLQVLFLKFQEKKYKILKNYKSYKIRTMKHLGKGAMANYSEDCNAQIKA